MIFVVDDEPIQRETCMAHLTSSGHLVRTFANATEALEAARITEPDCILSDIRMPGMDGFGFFRAYKEQFPGRQTPFLFLSSLDADEHVVTGLDLGADDYLTKPISPVQMQARVRHALARCRRRGPAAFSGDLSRISLMRVLQFCENKGLHGELHVTTGGQSVELALSAGEIAESDLEKLDRVFGAASGTFSIFVRPLDFGEIADASLKGAPPSAPQEKPMGQLSGVRMDQRLFQIQTEFTILPAPAFTTIVVLDGRTVHKKSTPADTTLSRTEMEAAMSRQHQDIEQTLRRRSMQDMPAADLPAESAMARFTRLLDEGYEALRAKDYVTARETWEQALVLDPEHKTLRLNLEILRKKTVEQAN
ncbi:response regulator [Myxococcota bacterium]|nr:response regulator [Myxococcota bacterium]MBU1412380.1 response regulator [Myxococcota bacterium]MBU1510973.1 response regulator [Myxococcota bacterium]PKN27163.1 MAG: hypothetical protein CVU65_03440 [Deltaproteobacteria bacterium HGW-Deltaproteobacteria-22]